MGLLALRLPCRMEARFITSSRAPGTYERPSLRLNKGDRTTFCQYRISQCYDHVASSLELLIYRNREQ
jgi:hypothetical protein